jgi:hypothetical protein
MMIHHTTRTRRLGLPALGHGDRLASALGGRLDDGFHFFRHVAPGGGDPIDAVVVGPGGTWTITETGERGRFRHRNGHWYRWNRGTESWVPWDATPVLTARLAGHRLGLYLERAALPASVEACLLPDPQAEVTWEPDDRIGVRIEPDADRLGELMGRDEVLTPAQIDRIVALLDPRQPLPQLAPSAPRG